MKIHISYNLTKGPWGGGNQFLKALRGAFIKVGVYSESISKADVLIFNSYNDIWPLIKSFFFYSKKIRAYRLGPIFHTYRKGLKWKFIDYVTILIANLFAGLIIFQSTWSHEEAKKLGLWKSKKFTIIGNAVDASVFYRKEFKDRFPGEAKRLIYTSWSSNMKKGFAYLKFLDENLDFTKYHMTFIGNSPFQFKNIEMIKALPSNELAEKLRESDVFISPVEDDACSNALLQGLASGIPVVALSSGGNPELVSKGGELFSNGTELLGNIEKVAKNLKFYYDHIEVLSIEDVADEYIKSIKNLC